MIDVDLSNLGAGDALTNTATVQATDNEGTEANDSDTATVERPVPPAFVVTGYKWEDLDAEGDWGSDEPGLPGG